ncbi:hypothetical protein E2C01_031635 [Portunus trituberculatus]|uniref:Uncharacterized protein n=1 Tax=Portunus trituberculatus TaxID=210409 RepID=A0A5B7EU02_PORTR|nr:hypothetical protein [Portunus trituberculatus]
MCELRYDSVSGVRLHRAECCGNIARTPVKPVKPVFTRGEFDKTLRLSVAWQRLQTVGISLRKCNALCN